MLASIASWTRLHAAAALDSTCDNMHTPLHSDAELELSVGKVPSKCSCQHGSGNLFCCTAVEPAYDTGTVCAGGR